MLSELVHSTFSQSLFVLGNMVQIVDILNAYAKLCLVYQLNFLKNAHAYLGAHYRLALLISQLTCQEEVDLLQLLHEFLES